MSDGARDDHHDDRHDDHRDETRAVHAGNEPDAATGAVAPPIHPSTTFLRGADGTPVGGYVYARSANPTRERLERALVGITPGAGAAAAFASGSAAAAAVLRTAPRGARIVTPNEMYHGLRAWLDDQTDAFGWRVVTVDASDDAALVAAIEPHTALVWVETPSNPSLELTDLAAVVKAARRVGATIAVDATWTPPGVADPFGAGADLVVHSTTKYLSGHSDVVGGVVLARSEHDRKFERVRTLQTHEGAVPSPFDAWLTLRGLRTLALRVRAACDGAERIAAFLSEHPAILEVAYPGSPKHPRHELARRQMRRFGAMLAVRVRGGEEAAARVAAGTRLFAQATSLGGVESLIEHRAPVEGPATATPADLLRISVGIEHPDDLIDDLRRALASGADGDG